MSILCPTDPPELATFLARIRKKKKDYERYAFTPLQDKTLRAFFDLAQEFEALETFYKVVVFVPKEFMGFDCALYLRELETGKLKIVCDSLSSLKVCGMNPPQGIEVREEPYKLGDSYVIPIRGKRKIYDSKPLSLAKEIIGMLEVFPLSHFQERDKLFFEKYANRIGYNLHYKFITIQNEEHIKFINTLVADIEHNVIVPNMRYKIFLSNLQKKIHALQQIFNLLNEAVESGEHDACPHVKAIGEVHQQLKHIVSDLMVQYEEVYKHYQNTSLFLETLLRRDHFEKGHLVLRRKMCRFKKEVIDPQIERYAARLERRGIKIDNQLGGVPDEDIPLMVDIGLISQVYANLFSNAEKYCQEVIDDRGNKVKFMSYGREVLPDFFGPGQPGIKFNVFTTGPHIPPEEAELLFSEGFRGRGAEGKPGVGHGLHFIKKVVEVHGGKVGYEPTPLGNNFYFVLPLQSHIPEVMGSENHASS